MIFELPLDRANSTGFEIEANFDGTDYRLLFRWNARENGWYLTLKNTNNDILKPSCKLVNQSYLFRKYTSLGTLPAGAIIIADQGGDTDPELDDLGERHKFLYFDEAELATL